MAAKLLLSIIAVFTFSNAQAYYTETIDISPIDYKVSDLCPSDVICFTDGTQIDLEYEWPCDTEVINFGYKVKQIENEIHVFLQTTISYTSVELTCQGLVRHKKIIALPNRYGEVILHSEAQQNYATM